MTDDEAMVPRIKRVSKEKKKLKIPVLNILLVLFCSFLLMVSTFIQFNITHFILPFDIFSNKALTKADFLYTYLIIPQVPAVMFVAGLLGRRLGITSIVIYILTGLFLLPVFALGGGIRYVLEPGFGYIMAYIPAVFFTGSILNSGFSFKNILKAALIGVVTIHFIGIIYMLFICAVKHEGWAFIKGWILSQSMLKIAYDYVLSLIALFAAKYANKYVKYLIS